MKKVTLLLLILFLVMGASGGYGYYVIVLEDGADAVSYTHLTLPTKA